MAGGEGAASPLRPGRAEAHVHPSMHDTVVGRTDTATITSGVSRLGSTVTNSGCTRAALGPSFSIAAATSLRVVEHTSEQDVQPKSTSRCLPRKSRSVTWLPSPSHQRERPADPGRSARGLPIAATPFRQQVSADCEQDQRQSGNPTSTPDRCRDGSTDPSRPSQSLRSVQTVSWTWISRASGLACS